jgi:uncharacterized Zn finger protein (UPF0148 family)
MRCQNCKCPLEKHELLLCSSCEEEQEKQDERERIEHEEQLEKARAAGVPFDQVHDVIQFIYFR